MGRCIRLHALLAPCAWILLLAAADDAPGADSFDAIGWNALQHESATEVAQSGRGIRVLQAELATNACFAPDRSLPEMAGKTFTIESWTYSGAVPSKHATDVATLWYAWPAGLAPSVTDVRVAEASYYLFASTKLGARAAPTQATWRVENHSWIGEMSNNAVELTRRVDFRAVRDNVIVVAGLNNGAGTAVPTLLAHLYNGIVVGVSSGQHSRGGTRFDGLGRSKPDLVAPATATSYATPLVSGAATFLLGAIEERADLADAARIDALKAVLLADTTREPLPGWSRTVDHPLDPVFGAGQLNIKRSHQVLLAGRSDPTATSALPACGWDANRTTRSQTTYLLDLSQISAGEFVAALTWNREVSPSADFTEWSAELHNLDLELWALDGASLIAESRSTLDNVELIAAAGLPPARYALVVTSDTPGVPYGIAWSSEGALGLVPPNAPVACRVSSAADAY